MTHVTFGIKQDAAGLISDNLFNHNFSPFCSVFYGKCHSHPVELMALHCLYIKSLRKDNHCMSEAPEATKEHHYLTSWASDWVSTCVKNMFFKPLTVFMSMCFGSEQRVYRGLF